MRNQKSTKGNRWHYRLEGRGPCLVLLHGFPESGKLWDELAGRLSSDYRLFIPDLPGVGGTPYQPGITMESMAEELAETLRGEGVDRYWIAGHSMGGYLALAHARAYGSGTAGISLIHSSARADSPEKREQRRKTIRLIEQGGQGPFLRQMVPALFGEAYRSGHPGKVEERVEQAMSIPPESLIAFYEAMIQRRDQEEWLRSTDLPVQWIMGSEDTITPPESTWPQTSWANRTFVKVMKDCGHMSMIENPGELARALRSFGEYIFREKDQ